MLIAAGIFILLLAVMDILIVIGDAVLGELRMRDSTNHITARTADEGVELPTDLRR